VCVCVYLIASKSRDDGLQVSDAMQLDVCSRPTSPQQLDMKSSPSVASSSSSLRHDGGPVHDDIMQSSPSRRRNSPLETPTGHDVTGQPRGRLVTSEDGRPAVSAVDDSEPNTTAGLPALRRRAVNLSDLRSCALIQTQMKTRKASASWRYVNNTAHRKTLCIHRAYRFSAHGKKYFYWAVSPQWRG